MTNYLPVSTILDKVPEMNLEEVGTPVLLVNSVRWSGKMRMLQLLSMEDKILLMLQSKINETKTKYPLLVAIFDRIHHMNLKETFTGLLVMDALTKSSPSPSD